MKKILLIISALVVVGATGCVIYIGAKRTEPNQNTASAAQDTSHKQVDLATVMKSLQKQFPTVTQTYIYTESQDPNSSLGKPGGYYVAGAEFYDTQTNTPPTQAAFGADSGGAIEVYANATDASKRASYLEGFQSDPTLNPGAVKQVGVYVLRASQNYTASQQTAVISYLASQVQ